MARGIYRVQRSLTAKQKPFFLSAAPQLAYPTADVTDGNWTNESGNNTNLYASLDEANPSDSDYIQSELAPNASTCKVRLGTVTDPTVHYGHKLDFRFCKSPASSKVMNWTVRIKQSTTTIASRTYTDISGEFIDGSLMLTEAEAGNITDYTILDVEFEATQA